MSTILIKTVLPSQLKAQDKGILFFVQQYGVDLAKALKGSNIFVGVAVAQKCWESGYGKSDLAKKYNNFGGIRQPRGGQLKLSSGTTSTGYAIFPSAYNCFLTYVNVLLYNEQQSYVKAGLLTAKTPQEQLKAIAKGGYCESPPPDAYYNLVVNFINSYNKLFDTQKIV